MRLADADAMATIAVRDLNAARPFYAETLGLKLDGEARGVARFRSGNSVVIVYESSNAGTNRATSATWTVDDAEEVVRALAAKGVVFEHYDDLPGLTRQGDLHVAGSFKGAWLKDPDGNILHVLSV